MIVTLARWELRLLRADRRVWWAVWILAAMVLLAFAATTLGQARDLAAKQQVAKAERERWLAQDPKDPHSAAHYSIYAFKPAAALAMLDPGIEPFVGQAVWLEAHQQNDMLYRPQGEASVLQRAGLANPAALLLKFAPLLAFMLAFAAIALDRERGTLRLALGAARSPLRIVAGKALAIWSLLIVALVLPPLIGALGVGAALGPLSADAALRATLWGTAMALYLALLVAIGLAATLHARSARVALAALFGLWMVLAIALPRWAGDAVSRTHPLPSTQAIRAQLQKEAPSYWMADEAREHEAALLKRYGVTRKEDLPVNFRGAELDMAERHAHKVFDRVLGGFYDRVAAQDHGYAALGWLSPTVAMQSLSSTLAGTDFASHRAFIDAAEDYRRDLVNRMNAEVMAHRVADGERHEADRHLWAQIPPFGHAPPTLRNGAADAWRTTLALLGWAVAMVAALRWAARRVQP